MADIGDLLGSMMIGLIRARRLADEQTAALAEYYKNNPVLEGLSVPRIRIPELVIDMPFIVEDFVGGKAGEMKDPAVIAGTANSQLKSTLSEKSIELGSGFHDAFAAEVKNQLTKVRDSGHPIMEESVARGVQNAFANALSKTKTTLTASDRDAITKDLRANVAKEGIHSVTEPSSIAANIMTAEVKEKASSTNVVRLKITLKEEGLEWAVQANEAGGVERKLQPE